MRVTGAELRRLRLDFAVNTLAASPLVIRPVRRRLLRLAGIDIHPTASIHAGCWFGDVDVSIGAGAWINYGVWFDNSAPIRLGRNVNVGQQVLFCTSSHEVGSSERRAGPNIAAPIVVGDGTWIGSRVMILPGVTVGAGCIIAAGAVVTEDCAADGVFAGVPARRVRDAGG